MQIKLAGALGGISMEIERRRIAARKALGADFPDHFGNLAERLDGAELIICECDTDEPGISADGTRDVFRVNPTVLIDRYKRVIITRCGRKHGLVLDRRRDDMAAAVAHTTKGEI